MCGLKVRFSQSPERRGVLNYALRVEVLSATGMPTKIFVYHQSPSGVNGNTFAEFDHVATPVDFQEIPEDAASNIVPWYRTDKVVVWFRNVSDLNLAKQMFVDDIYALQKTYDVLTSNENFERQSDVEFTETGVHEESIPEGEGSIEQDIAAMKTEIDGKLSKDALDGVEFETNDAAGIREAVKIMGNILGAKIIKSIALIFGLCSLCAHGAGFSGAPYAQLDLDKNPIVVTNVTFDGLLTNVDINDITQDVAQVKAELAKKYEKPQNGIPATDLSQGVRDSLAKANTALQDEDISKKRDKTDLVVYNANGESTTDTLAKTSDLTIINDITRDVAQVQEGLAKKYEKPRNGIPAADLSQGVRDSLAKANTALQDEDISKKRDKTDLAVYNANGDATTDTLAKISDLVVIGGITQDIAQVKAELAKKYEKPTNGIPTNDLAQSVINSLNMANTALQAKDISGKRDKTDLAVYNANGDATTDTLAKISDISAIDTSLLVFTTWEELKNLRQSGGLKPGQQYRITDYVATVGTWFYTDETSEGEDRDYAISASNKFDIVVTAISSNVIDEVARALRHNGDTYFPETTKFEAWKIWYCIDNDVRRFLWADEENGKGVIYRMIDERNNDVPYDFKSIQSIPSSAAEMYLEPVYVFSLTYNEDEDRSLNMEGGVYNNKISPAYGVHEVTSENEETGEIEIVEVYRAQKLNLIHIIGDDCHDNVFSTGCEKNVISGSCNHFGEYCLNNFISNGSYNRFGNDCANNRLGDKCSSNTFGNSCYNNTLDGSDIRCTFGNGASENIIPSYCRALTLQNDVRSMELVLPTGTVYYRNVEFKSGLRNVTIEDTRSDMTYKYKVFKPKDSVEVSVVSPTLNVKQ